MLTLLTLKCREFFYISVQKLSFNFTTLLGRPTL